MSTKRIYCCVSNEDNTTATGANFTKLPMKKHVAITLLVLTTLGVLKAHVEIERQDGGVFLAYQGKKHDVLGVFQDQGNALLRQCRDVRQIDASSALAGLTLAAIQNFSPPDSQHARLLGLRQQDGWLLAELEFTTLNPAVVLLHSAQERVSVVEGAIWSGTTAPWASAPFIRRYIRERAPQAPRELMDCFDPAGVLFK